MGFDAHVDDLVAAFRAVIERHAASLRVPSLQRGYIDLSGVGTG